MAITVGELIEQLEKFDKELPTMTEGCDCIGDCDGTEHVENADPYFGVKEYVLLTRGQGAH